MSDYNIPDLPSDEELGITKEDRENYGEELGADQPEMSDAERAALLGGTTSSAAGQSADDAGAESDEKAKKKAAKAAAKKAAKKERQAKREAKKAAKQERAAKKAGASTENLASETEVPAATAADPITPSAPPKKKWRGVATLAFLAVIAALSSSRTGIPSPSPANAPEEEFSSARAMATLVDVARIAHPPGSPEHARVRTVLMDHLVDLGIEPHVQTTTSVIQRGSLVRSATVRNIVGRMAGSDPSGTVLVTAHYDSREIAVGAGDDGSGIVSILEALRAIRASDTPLRNDVIVLFTDAEELGLLGARAFVNEHEWMSEVDFVLSFEMRGGGGPSIMFETGDQNGWAVNALRDFDPSPFANSLAFEVYQRMPNDTDFTPFKEAGVQGLNFAAIDNAHVYHQTMDTPEELSESTLQHHGENTLNALRWFGSAELSDVDAPNVVYLSLPGLGVVTYPEFGVWVLSGLIVLGLIGFVITALRAGQRPARAGIGLVLSLLLGGIAWFSGGALLSWVAQTHAEVGALHGSLAHSEGWYVLALGLGAVGLVALTSWASYRWVTTSELLLGAVVLPSIAAVAIGFIAPLAAMNLQIPVLAALVSGIVLCSLGDRSEHLVGWIASLLLAVPVIVVFQPLVELVWLALTFSFASGFAVIIMLGWVLCLPAVAHLRQPNGWWVPAASLVASLAALGLGWSGARAAEDRPAPSTLVYAYEHGSGEALWATSPDVAENADSEAAQWATTRAGGAFEESRDLEGFGYPAGVVPVRIRSAPSVRPPEVMLAADTTVAGVRRVTMRVRSSIAAERLAFHLDSPTDILAINGVPISDPSGTEWVDHWGEPDGSVELDLEMPAGLPIGVQVVEHLLRPGELFPGADPFDRAGVPVAPNVNRFSDRAMFRYSVQTFVDPAFAIVTPPDVVLPGPGEVSRDPLPSDSLLTEEVETPTLDEEYVPSRIAGGDSTGADSVAVPDSLPAASTDSASGDSASSGGAARDTVHVLRRRR